MQVHGCYQNCSTPWGYNGWKMLADVKDLGCCYTMILKMSDTMSDDIAKQFSIDFN